MAIVAAGKLPPARHKGPSAMTRRPPSASRTGGRAENTQLIEMKNDILHFMSSRLRNHMRNGTETAFSREDFVI